MLFYKIYSSKASKSIRSVSSACRRLATCNPLVTIAQISCFKRNLICASLRICQIMISASGRRSCGFGPSSTITFPKTKPRSSSNPCYSDVIDDLTQDNGSRLIFGLGEDGEDGGDFLITCKAQNDSGSATYEVEVVFRRCQGRRDRSSMWGYCGVDRDAHHASSSKAPRL